MSGPTVPEHKAGGSRSLADAILYLHNRDGLGDCGECRTPSGGHVPWPCDTARLVQDETA